jgi:hypothetical protein
MDLGAHHFFDLFFEQADFRTFLADDDSGPCSKNSDAKMLGGTFNFDFGNTGVVELIFNEYPQPMVFQNVVRIIFVGKPSRFPSFYNTQSHSDGIYFLAQALSSFLIVIGHIG